MPLNPRLLKGRYEIQRHLGQTDRQTLLAKDRQTQELVVVKLLTFGGKLKWETFKLFEREAKILKELKHPAIPRYLDYFDVETDFGRGFALVQSYIDAPSLAAHIQAGRTFSEIELKQIVTAVLEILIYLHHRHPPIIHRDLKPENILLGDRSGNYVGQVYLVDFGSVQAATKELGTRTVVGTYGYMPLEQFGGRAVPASDLYGLGTTIIYLASGQHPADLPQQDFRISFENFVNLSSSFVEWLQWMTQPSLERRLESADRALEALENPKLQTKPALVVSKPIDSKVVLNKKAEYLEICIPPVGFSMQLLFMIGFATFWNGFLVVWYSIAIATWSQGGWFAALFALGHLGVGVWLILSILFTLFGNTLLYIDNKQISLRYQLFGLKYYRPRPMSRHKIVKLERTNTSYKKDSDGDRVEVKPRINIWAGTKKFKIGGNGILSEIELDWISHELGDWLKLPVVSMNNEQ
ncbi:serine/threonine-protein kinase [Myxosarcina sp. GI1]|uniref:serine/threonine protein kinase n=1 Tax=Myxosarcina sp. GI1 TaxID=1541065 RepID=UPI00056AEDD4|nr:serine/threonine-protein kinase [Myxosarcina sp. GI1]